MNERKQLILDFYKKYAPDQKLTDERIDAINNKYGDDTRALLSDFYKKYAPNEQFTDERYLAIEEKYGLKKKEDTQLPSSSSGQSSSGEPESNEERERKLSEAQRIIQEKKDQVFGRKPPRTAVQPTGDMGRGNLLQNLMSQADPVRAQRQMLGVDREALGVDRKVRPATTDPSTLQYREARDQAVDMNASEIVRELNTFYTEENNKIINRMYDDLAEMDPEEVKKYHRNGEFDRIAYETAWVKENFGLLSTEDLDKASRRFFEASKPEESQQFKLPNMMPERPVDSPYGGGVQYDYSENDITISVTNRTGVNVLDSFRGKDVPVSSVIPENKTGVAQFGPDPDKPVGERTKEENMVVPQDEEDRKVFDKIIHDYAQKEGIELGRVEAQTYDRSNMSMTAGYDYVQDMKITQEAFQDAKNRLHLEYQEQYDAIRGDTPAQTEAMRDELTARFIKKEEYLDNMFASYYRDVITNVREDLPKYKERERDLELIEKRAEYGRNVRETFGVLPGGEMAFDIMMGMSDVGAGIVDNFKGLGQMTGIIEDDSASDRREAIIDEAFNRDIRNFTREATSTLGNLALIVGTANPLTGVAGRLGAGTKVAQRIGFGASSYLNTAGSSYREAIDAGLEYEDAILVSQTMAMTSAGIEVMFPGEFVFGGSFKPLVGQYLKAVNNGVSKKEALKMMVNQFGKEVIGENVEETFALISDYAMKRMADATMNSEYNPELAAEDFSKTAALTTVATGLFGGARNMSNFVNANLVGIQLQYDAVQKYDDLVSEIDQMKEDGLMDDATAERSMQNLDRLKKSYDLVQDLDVGDYEKAILTTTNAERERLEDKKKELNLESELGKKAAADIDNNIQQIDDLQKKILDGQTVTEILGMQPTPPVESEEVTEQRAPREGMEGVSTPEERAGTDTGIESLVGRRVTYNGESGFLYKDGPKYEIETDSGTIYEVGNEEQLGRKPIDEIGISEETFDDISYNNEGDIVINGVEYINPNDNPEDAIEYDKKGNVVAVRVQNKELGSEARFTKDRANALAFEIKMRNVNEDAFNEYLETNEEARKEIEQHEGKVQQAASQQEVESTGEVQQEEQITEEDAIQERETEEVPVGERTEDSPEVEQEVREQATEEEVVQEEEPEVEEEKTYRVDAFIDRIKNWENSSDDFIKETMGAFNLPVAIAKQALTATRKALEAGKTIYEAMEVGSQKIREWARKNGVNEDEAVDRYKRAIKPIPEDMLSEEQREARRRREEGKIQVMRDDEIVEEDAPQTEETEIRGEDIPEDLPPVDSGQRPRQRTARQGRGATSDLRGKQGKAYRVDSIIDGLKKFEDKQDDFIKGTLGAMNIPVAVVRGAATTIRKSLEAGKTLYQAMEDGSRKIREWAAKNNQDPEEAVTKFQSSMASAIGDIDKALSLEEESLRAEGRTEEADKIAETRKKRPTLRDAVQAVVRSRREGVREGKQSKKDLEEVKRAAKNVMKNALKGVIRRPKSIRTADVNKLITRLGNASTFEDVDKILDEVSEIAFKAEQKEAIARINKNLKKKRVEKVGGKKKEYRVSAAVSEFFDSIVGKGTTKGLMDMNSQEYSDLVQRILDRAKDEGRELTEAEELVVEYGIPFVDINNRTLDELAMANSMLEAIDESGRHDFQKRHAERRERRKKDVNEALKSITGTKNMDADEELQELLDDERFNENYLEEDISNLEKVKEGGEDADDLIAAAKSAAQYGIDSELEGEKDEKYIERRKRDLTILENDPVKYFEEEVERTRRILQDIKNDISKKQRKAPREYSTDQLKQQANEHKRNNIDKFRDFMRKVFNNPKRFIFDANMSLEYLADLASRERHKAFEGVLNKLISEPLKNATFEYKNIKRNWRKAQDDAAKRIFGSLAEFRKAVNSISDQKDRGIKITTRAKITETNTIQKDENGRPIFEEPFDLVMSDDEALYVIGLAKDPGNYASLSSSGYLPVKKRDADGKPIDYDFSIIEKLKEQVDPRMTEFLDWIVNEHFPKAYEDISPSYQKLYGFSLPKVDQYMPRFLVDNVDFSEAFMTHSLPLAINPMYVKMRARNSNRPIKAGVGMMDAYLAYNTAMANFAAFSPVAKEVGVVMNNPNVQAALDRFNGDGYAKLMEGRVRAIVGSTTNKSPSAFAWLNTLRRAGTFGQLALKPLLAIKQLASIPAFSVDLPAGQWIKTYPKAMKNLMKIQKTLLENSAWYADRNDLGDVDIEEIQRAARKKGRRGRWLARKKGQVTTVGLLPSIMADKGAILIGGAPIYQYHYDKFRKENPDATNKEAVDHAVREFEKSASRSQQSADNVDLSYYQKSDDSAEAFLKLFSSYKNSPLQYFRQSYSSYVRMARDIANGRAPQTSDVRRFLMYHSVLPTIFQYITLGAPGLLSDWDEDDSDDMLRAMFLGNFNAPFMLGDVLAWTADKVQEKPYAGKFPTFNATLTGWYKSIDKGQRLIFNPPKDKAAKENMEEALLQNLLTSAGVPYSGPDNIFDAANAFDEGDYWAAMMRGLGYSEYVVNTDGTDPVVPSELKDRMGASGPKEEEGKSRKSKPTRRTRTRSANRNRTRVTTDRRTRRRTR